MVIKDDISTDNGYSKNEKKLRYITYKGQHVDL